MKITIIDENNKTLELTYEERRNLAFAFISGRKFGQNPVFKADTEEVILHEFNEFLRGLPDLIKADEE